MSRTLCHDAAGFVITNGDSNSPDLEPWALRNIEGNLDFDSAIQTEMREHHYGGAYITTEDIANGEDFVTWAWDNLASFDELESNVEVIDEEPSLLEGLKYDDSHNDEQTDAMNCRINGVQVNNGVQAQIVVNLASHVLVSKYGLCPLSVARSGAEVIAVVQTAAEHAIELGLKPRLIGFARLFSQAGDFQFMAEAARPKPAPSVLPPALTREHRSSQSGSTPSVEAAAKTITRPSGSDWAGRIETAQGLAVLCTCGCKSRVLTTAAVVPSIWESKKALGVPHIGTFDLWRVARNPRHRRGIRGSMFSFEEAMAGLTETEQLKLKNNNVLLSAEGETETHRPSHFVVEISDGAFSAASKILSRNGRRTPDQWRTLHSALGTGSDIRVQQAQKARIPIWLARERGLVNVVDLRVLTSLCYDAAKRRADQKAWETKRAGWARRQQQR